MLPKGLLPSVSMWRRVGKTTDMIEKHRCGDNGLQIDVAGVCLEAEQFRAFARIRKKGRKGEKETRPWLLLGEVRPSLSKRSL